MSLYIDLSEFLSNPIRTGIQRISGEMCRYMEPDSVVPLRLTPKGYVSLPTALTRAIGRHFSAPGKSELQTIRRLGAPEAGSPVRISARDTVLVAEVFDDDARLAFFEQLSDRELDRYRFIVYDLLPITNPEYFPVGSLMGPHGYYCLLRRAPHCGFISEYTRHVYYTRLKRSSDRAGTVLPLGCDALGNRPPEPALSRPLHFSVLGTIEPRKNHKLILEAFEPLLRDCKDLRLSFLGRMGWVDPEFAKKVKTLAANPSSGFHFYPELDDRSIRKHVQASRATVYVSAAEGYGLPPVESLWLGTPVIASGQVPSLESLGETGIHIVDPLTPENLRHAITAFSNTSYADQKVKEAHTLDLPTWQSFTESVLAWCSAS